MKRKYLLVLILIGLLAVITIIAVGIIRRPNPTANPTYTQLESVHALRIDYLDLSNSQPEADKLATQMQQAGINLTALSAGRVDWTYFPWKGHPDRWSSEVRHTGVDYLARDSTHFGKWSHVSAVVDILAPRYLKIHPEQAAVSSAGVPSANLVSTMDLVEGQFGQDVLDLIEFIALSYPVNSVTITELVYYADGFGENDKSAFMSYSGLSDWPRTASGEIDIDAPSIGEWRIYEIGRFLEKAAAIMHAHNKQLFFEVRASIDANGNVMVKNGTDMNAFLKYADRLVVWGNHDMDTQSPVSVSKMASYLTQFGTDKVIMMIGLWDNIYGPDFPKEQMTAIPAEDLKVMLQSSAQGGVVDQWVSPSFLMGPDHWNVLDSLWGTNTASP